MEELVVQVSGKDLESVTGRVKGILQAHVRATHKYEGATFDVHRREGSIVVRGVPRSVVEAGLKSARAKLLPQRHFTYEIEEATAAGDAEDPHALAEAMFVQWTETTQKEWEERAAQFERDIAKLTTENNKLRQEAQNLKELRRQDAEQLASLKRSYDEVSRLIERISEERSQSPLEMADRWVEDWSVNAMTFEQELGQLLDGDGLGGADLIQFDFPALRKAVARATGASSAPETLEEVEALIVGRSWEESEEYARLRPEYERARAELEYLEAVERGDVPMPESLREKLFGSVDEKAIRKVIEEFGALERVHAQKTAESDRIADLSDQYGRAERLRTLMAENDATIPAVVACRDSGGGWYVEIRLPRSDGGVLRPGLQELAQDVVAKGAGRKPEVVEDEGLVRVGARLAGKYKSWKDASRVQETVCLELGRQFESTPLASIGFRLNPVKVMVGPQPS